MRIAMYMCMLFPWSRISPNMEGVAERKENCNVCVCILFLWSPISPTWRGLLTEMRIAMSVCVYYSLGHIFPQHGGVAHRNENCNVCKCILFPWSRISPNMEGVAHRNENLQGMYVYIIPLITSFTNMEGVALRKENCNVCMCILFRSTPISPNMEGVAHINENCNVCMCILIPCSPIFPAWRVLLRELRIAMSVCVYYSIDHLFSRHGWGCSQKLELRCLYVYIIPWSRISPNMEGDAERS